MKRLIVIFLMLIRASAANAQGGSILWYWYDDGDGPAEVPLTDACPGGTPIPDGATIQIFWDNDGNGPDDDDPQPTLCDTPPLCEGGPVGTVNRNQFALNGEAQFIGAGYFAMESAFASVGGLPPNPQRYYLRLCIGGMRWESSVCTLTAGAREYGPSSFGANAYTWTCSNVPCAGCQPSAPPQNAAASVDRCDGIELTWSYPHQTDEDVLHYLVYRAGTLIATIVDTTVHSYLDTAAPVGQVTSYQLAAVKFCGQDSAVSPQVPANGNRPFPPPQPTTMTATENVCNNVTINWNYSSNQGLDYWAIFRAGVLVDTVINNLTPGSRTYVHVGAPGGVAQYCVYGVSNACSLGTPLCDNGEALQPPPQVQNVLATDGMCNVTQITWTDVTGETGYSVTRANSDGGSPTVIASNLAPGTVQFNYTTGACNTVYRFWVTANNTCGGVASVFDTGFMICTPSTPLSFQAADGVNCDMVALTWANASNETYYKIMRGIGSPTDSIGAAAENATSYNDSTAVPGTVYTYAVAAGNLCGTSANSTSNTGSRRAPPPQVTGVSATDDNCNNITITWTNITGEDSFQVRRDGLRIGVTAVNVINFVDNLATPGVTYAYTVIAYNACGGVESAPDNGMRPPGLDVPANVVASDMYCDSIVVTWDDVAGEDSFRVFRDAVQIGTTLQNVTTFTDFTSGPGTFSYMVAAFNVCGQSPMSNPDNGNQSIPPSQVTGLQAIHTCDSVSLEWMSVAQADSYFIRRDGNVIAILGAPVTQYMDDPGDANVHDYTVSAWSNECGSGAESEPVAVGPVTIPDQVTGVSASNNFCDHIEISWNSVAAADSYMISREDMFLASTGAADTIYLDYDVGSGITYHYRVFAVSGYCESGASESAEGISNVIPATPSGVVASDSVCEHILITWNDVNFETGYVVRRNGVAIAIVDEDTTQYVDTPAPGSYIYRIQALNDCGASLSSSPNPGTRYSAPVTPSGLVQTGGNCGAISFSWINGSRTQSVYIARNGVAIDTVVIPQSTYVDSVGVAGTYLYYLIAANHCGPSDTSTELEASAAEFPLTPENVTATDNDCDEVIVEWSPSPGTVDDYIIFRDGARFDSVGGDLTLYADSTVISGYAYVYAVSARSNSCGETAASFDVIAEIEMTSLPEAPQVVISIIGNDAILNWNSIAETAEGCPLIVTGYLVFYAPTSDGEYYYHGFTSDTTYTHVRAAQFTETMFYQVVAYTGAVNLAGLEEGMRMEAALEAMSDER